MFLIFNEGMIMTQTLTNPLGEALRQNNHLKFLMINAIGSNDLYLPFIKALEKNTILEELYFMNNTFTNDGVDALLNAISKNKNLNLKILYFKNVNIEDKTREQELCEELRKIETFKILYDSVQHIFKNQTQKNKESYERLKYVKRYISL